MNSRPSAQNITDTLIRVHGFKETELKYASYSALQNMLRKAEYDRAKAEQQREGE